MDGIDLAKNIKEIKDASDTTVFIIVPNCVSYSPEVRIALDNICLICQAHGDRPRIPVTVIQQGSTYYTPLNKLYKEYYYFGISNYVIYYKQQFMTINQLHINLYEALDPLGRLSEYETGEDKEAD